MKIKTWTDRITDESNLWLNAVKMDDAQNFLNASALYLNDACDCIQRNLLVRAALSCICAADCLAKSGYSQDSRRLFLEAAIIYEENADRIIGVSVRESLWSLQEAYECFLTSSDYFRAQQVFDKYTSLVRKLNPFFGDSEAIEILQQKKKAVESIVFHNDVTNVKISNELYDVIEKMVRLRRSSLGEKQTHGVDLQKKEKTHEKSSAC